MTSTNSESAGQAEAAISRRIPAAPRNASTHQRSTICAARRLHTGGAAKVSVPIDGSPLVLTVALLCPVRSGARRSGGLHRRPCPRELQLAILHVDLDHVSVADGAFEDQQRQVVA